jgi:hypothetical protein
MDYNYFISELNAMIANAQRVKRELEQAQAEEIAQPRTAAPGQHAPAPQPSQIADPLAKSMSDLVTPKQLGMIRALAREAGVDHDLECQDVFRCKTEELSKRAASSFIDHLKGLQREFTARRAS